MAARTNINVNITTTSGLSHNNVATTASGLHFFVLWMNICLHNYRLNVVVPLSLFTGYGTVACGKERAY